MSTQTRPGVSPAPPTDGIDILRVAYTMWRGKLWILGLAFLSAVFSVVLVILLAPVYRAEVVLAPNEIEDSPSLPAGLGGLASIAGIDLDSSADSMQAIATLRSRVLIEEFIQDKELLPVLFADEWDVQNGQWIEDDPDEIPDLRDGVRLFTEKIRSVSEDSATGMVVLAVEWTDPALAAEWAEALVQRVNERLRTRDLENSTRRLTYLNEQLESASLIELRQAISRLIQSEIQTIMLARAEVEYAFRVIDPPRVPNRPVFPPVALLVAAATMFGGIAGALLVLFRSALSRRELWTASEDSELERG